MRPIRPKHANGPLLAHYSGRIDMTQAIEIGQAVQAEGIDYTVIANEKGWLTLQDADGNESKARPGKVNTIEEQVAEQAALDAPADGEEREWSIKCSECDCAWDLVQVGRPINIKCPECGAWCVVRLFPDRERYTRGLGTTASGNSTYDINDEVAQVLRGYEIMEAYAVAAERIIEVGIGYLSKAMKKDAGDATGNAVDLASYFAGRWESRNLGMQRMNLGNVLRGVLKREREDVEGIE